MEKIRFAAALVMGLGLGLASAEAQPAASAAKEVSILWPGGGTAAITALIPGFEAKSGYKVKLTKGSGQLTRKQIASGADFDVAVLQTPFPEVVASGNVVAKSQRLLSSLVVGVMVKKGAPKPDISTPDAVKKLLLSVKSLSYPDPAIGAVGVSFAATLEKMGLTDQVAAKAKLERNGAGSMQDTAKGDVEIGINFISEVEDPGVDIVGPLPASISPPTQLFGFVTTHAKNPAVAQALLDYLTSPQAASTFASSGMQSPAN